MPGEGLAHGLASGSEREPEVLLGLLCRLHRDASVLLAHSLQSEPDPRARWLLAWLAAHESRVAEAVEHMARLSTPAAPPAPVEPLSADVVAADGRLRTLAPPGREPARALDARLLRLYEHTAR